MPIGWFVGFLVLSFVIVLFTLRPKKSEKDMEKRLKILALTLKSENDAELEAGENDVPRCSGHVAP